MPESNENLGIAFALVFGAGAATAIGAAVVFFPILVKYANKKTLAISLGLSAGVMIYVSFVEIFQKSVKSFINAGNDFNDAYKYATACLFAGVVIMIVSTSEL
jgi:zinc transporter, ZIP family